MRVRKTKKNYYKVEPLYFIINPKSFVNIKIFYQSIQDDKNNFLGHKFKFEGFIIEEKDKNCKNILGLFQQAISNNKIVKGNSIIKNVKFITENENKINNEFIKQIKECEDVKSNHIKLLNELNEIRAKNKISIKNIFIEGIELVINIKNNKLYILLLVLFQFFLILGFYINK